MHPGRSVAWHNGGTAGFSSYASIKWTYGNWLVVLIHRDTLEITAIGNSLENAYFFGERRNEPPPSRIWEGLVRDLLLASARIPPWIRLPLVGVIALVISLLVKFLWAAP